MTAPLLLIPLDDRPPTYLFPQRIAAIAGIQLLTPPREMLGQFLRPGETDRIAAWLVEQAGESDATAAMIAADMLVFGGLVASRAAGIDETEALRRTEILREVKRTNPGLRLMVASVIMRISITASDQRVAQFYRDLIRYSELSWLVQHEADNELREDLRVEFQQIIDRIPPDVLEQYLSVRQRNHQVNRRMIELLAEGTLDDLILIQEDASRAGPHLGEQQALRELARSLHVQERVRIYPGADEGTQTLLARWLNRARVPQVQVRFTSTAGAAQTAPFEDRPLSQTVIEHMASAGVQLVSSGSELEAQGQAVLWVHTPCMGEEARQAVGEITALIEAGIPVGLADVRLPNGSDSELMTLLCQAGILPRLAAYAGWNTAGNTLGTAVAFLCAVLAARRARCANDPQCAERLFLWERYVDDWGYQRILREQVETMLHEQGLDSYSLGEAKQTVENEVRAKLKVWAEQLACNCGWTAGTPDLQIRLPWPRTFEVEVEAVRL